MSLRVASLDYLGTVAARLRKDAVCTQQTEIDELLEEVSSTRCVTLIKYVFVSSNLIIVHAKLVTMFSKEYKNNFFGCNMYHKKVAGVFKCEYSFLFQYLLIDSLWNSPFPFTFVLAF